MKMILDEVNILGDYDYIFVMYYFLIIFVKDKVNFEGWFFMVNRMWNNLFLEIKENIIG